MEQLEKSIISPGKNNTSKAKATGLIFLTCCPALGLSRWQFVILPSNMVAQEVQ